MSYYIATTLKLPFDEAIERTQDALKEQGFGIISRIDLSQAFKEKIGVDFRPYTILGACNPKLAHEALQLEDKVGTMLPCNVVVQAKSEGETEVAAIDPVASMQAIDNAELKEAAAEVRDRLGKAMRALEEWGGGCQLIGILSPELLCLRNWCPWRRELYGGADNRSLTSKYASHAGRPITHQVLFEPSTRVRHR